MDLYKNIGEQILRDYFDFYYTEKLDDTEYIPVVRVIIEALEKSMLSAGLDKQKAKRVKDELIGFNRNLYIEEWLRHAKEDEDEVDIEEEAEAAAYYFDYVYKHGEHPR